MSHIRRGNFRGQYRGSALFCLALLVSLLLQMLLMAKAEARHSILPPPTPSRLGDPRELETFLDGVIGEQMRVDHIPGASVSVVLDLSYLF
jgi:hypothetical protein